MKCTRCKDTAVVALPAHNAAFCPPCFLDFFTGQVEKGIARHKLFTSGDRILVALSGGKDSLTLIYELRRLGYDVTGLHVDLGIPASSEAARSAVQKFCARHELPLIVLETAAEGLGIPLVKARLRRPVCSACGKIKRHYFNKIALEGGFTVLATGHNLDDEVARLFSNTLRWDTAYLSDQGPALAAEVAEVAEGAETEGSNSSYMPPAAKGALPLWNPRQGHDAPGPAICSAHKLDKMLTLASKATLSSVSGTIDEKSRNKRAGAGRGAAEGVAEGAAAEGVTAEAEGVAEGAAPMRASFVRKVKPLWRLTEFETANYAFLRGIDWHFAPCPYSKGASFTFYKSLWAALEERMPGRKLDFYQAFLERGRPAFAAAEQKKGEQLKSCAECGMPTSQDLCGVCRIRAAVRGEL